MNTSLRNQVECLGEHRANALEDRPCALEDRIPHPDLPGPHDS